MYSYILFMNEEYAYRTSTNENMNRHRTHTFCYYFSSSRSYVVTLIIILLLFLPEREQVIKRLPTDTLFSLHHFIDSLFGLSINYETIKSQRTLRFFYYYFFIFHFTLNSVLLLLFAFESFFLYNREQKKR